LSIKLVFIYKYQYLCKECRKLLTKKYREENKGKLNIKQKKYYKNHVDDKKKYDNIYRQENKDKISKYQKNYQKNYRIINKEKIKEQSRKYRENNKDKIKESNKKYLLKNPHIPAWRGLLTNSLERLGKSKESRTIDLLGYSALELKEHIEDLFTDGMTWENRDEWHIDHIKPLSSFESDTPLNIVNALDNLQPLWATTREVNGVIYGGNLNKGVK